MGAPNPTREAFTLRIAPGCRRFTGTRVRRKADVEQTVDGYTLRVWLTPSFGGWLPLRPGQNK